MQKLKVTIPKILRKNTSSLLLATSGSCGQICQFVTICVTAKCPLTTFKINSLLILLHYIIYYFADLCISSSLPSRQKVGIVSEWNSSRSIIDIFKIHQNLKADINPWMMTCIWQRGNRRLAQIYIVGAAKASRKNYHIWEMDLCRGNSQTFLLVNAIAPKCLRLTKTKVVK